MAKFIGRRVPVAIGKEASRGTGIGGNTLYWGRQTSLGFADKTDDVRIQAGIGQIADSLDKIVAGKFAEGEIEGYVSDQFLGVLLMGIVGAAPSAADNGDSTYTHTYTLSNTNQHQSLVIAMDDPIQDLMFKLAMLSQVEIVAELDEAVKFTAEFTSKVSTNTSQTPSISSENLFTRKDVKVRVAADASSLGAASDLDIKRLSLTITKNTERDNVLRTVEPVDILNKSIAIEGELRLTHEDNTWRDYMLNGDKKALRITFKNEDVTIGSGSANPTMELDLASVDFSGWEVDRSLDDVVSQTIAFTANYDLTDGLIESLTLLNTVASY